MILDISITYSRLPSRLPTHVYTVLCKMPHMSSNDLHALCKTTTRLQLRPVDDCLSLFTRPERAGGVPVLFDSFGLVLDAVARLVRRDKVPVPCLHGMRQDLSERVDVFEEALLSRHAQVVDQREVLRVLVEADATAMGNDGDIEPGRDVSQARWLEEAFRTHFLASNRTAMTSFTPPNLHASIWQ